LDEDTGRAIIQLLLELTRQTGKTLIMATHNPDIIPLADKVYRIKHGELVLIEEKRIR
jgi:putative ABC transport system ATP-binding protein